MARYYERRLPHWQPDDKWMFITWRLVGSMPHVPEILTRGLPAGQRFAVLDREADRAVTGPLWLTDSRVAEVVQDSILSGDGSTFDLAAWVIVPNHVHLILLPYIPVQEITRKIKGASAHRANQILGRRGPFWQGESYDHWIRCEDALDLAIRYVERNPVNAGFVDSIENWRWSSASLGRLKPAPPLPGR
jgi:putative transposase